ncbi:MAG: dihydrolipoyl dehydrogenase [bacterium]
MSDYDIGIIGAGPGGYVAAIRASQLGARVCLIERARVGGTCLNLGCIPTKTLVGCVTALTNMQQAEEFGIRAEEISFDFKKMMERKDRIVDRLTKGIRQLLKSNEIDLIRGEARIPAPGTLEVKSTEDNGKSDKLSVEKIIIATGSRPARIPAFQTDGERVITSDEALALTEVPERLLIVGGGVIGCEFACIFNALGSKVTVVEVMPDLIQLQDKQISRQLRLLMKKSGVTILTNESIREVRKGSQEIEIALESGKVLQADIMLVSIGRVFNSDNLGLEELGMKTSKGMIMVDNRMRTSVEGVYAVGDVSSRLRLAYIASAEGIVAATNCMGKRKTMDYSFVPTCIFTMPEIAAVGLTEEQAKAEGYDIGVGKFPFSASGKALAMGETDSFIKVIADHDEDRVLGVHIIGPHATDIIHEAALAIRMGVTIRQLVDTVHAHPTLSEVLVEAAEDVKGISIHLPRKRG